LKKKTIVIGCDNAATELKETIKGLLEELGYEYEDVGVNSSADNTIYPQVAETVCKTMINSSYSKLGILICGTGIGMSIVANKFPGIYASVCHDNYSAERARLSNDCNVLCMGARVIGAELAKKITKDKVRILFVENIFRKRFVF
jgi:ribose 5-phosphate isomerase B